MSKTFVLAEKPSVGRELGRVLGCPIKKDGYMEGNKYVVSWALGHLVELADPQDYDKRLEPGICRTFQCCRTKCS